MQETDKITSTAGMYTSCPECLQQFRIQASHLSMAAGQVECGACGHQFNAIARLSDQPIDLSKEEYDSSQKPDADDEISVDESEPEFDIPSSPAEEDLQAEDEEDLNDIPAALVGDFSEDDLPEELRETKPPKRSALSTFFLFVGVLVLIIVAVAQAAWFNRDQLLVRYPEITPTAQRVCQYIDKYIACEIFRHKDVQAIKLVNRDVRTHPLYEDSLLVNATMANESDTIQPFPLIQLALFNPAGEVIGYREFQPKQYLDESIDIESGMAPQSPIHFILEVSGPTENAVSFEFHFL